MKKLGKAERQFMIIREIFARQKVTVEGLARICEVSRESIRSDLRDLKAITPGLFNKFYGGAEILHREWPYGKSSFCLAMDQNYHEKELLAAYVVQHCIPHNAFLAIDIGTTSTIFARELARSHLRGLNVATHSASVPIELLESNAISNLRVLGGRLLSREAAFLPTNGMTPEWYPFAGADYIAVMSTESFSVAHGAATTQREIALLDQSYIAKAKSVIMLMDRSKFDKGATHTITMCGLELEKTRWLSEEKPFKLVTNTDWGREAPPRQFEELAKRIRPQAPRDEEFSEKIAVFKSTLRPKPRMTRR